MLLAPGVTTTPDDATLVHHYRRKEHNAEPDQRPNRMKEREHREGHEQERVEHGQRQSALRVDPAIDVETLGDERAQRVHATGMLDILDDRIELVERPMASHR